MAMNQRMDMMSRLTHYAQHPIFRIAAIGFSLFSSLAVYDFFLPLATDGLWHIALVIMTASFVALNYFTLRGWAHRLLQKRSAKSYAAVAFLCMVVEVICNLSHAANVFLQGAQAAQIREWLFWPTLVVLCSMPVFGFVLARIDVDLMMEKGAIPQMGNNFSVPSRSHSAAPGPQMSYPPMPQPGYQGNTSIGSQQNAKKPNPLQNWWNQQGTKGASGQQQPPLQQVVP